MVHSTHLIDLRLKMTSALKYSPSPKDYNGPIDDIIIFAHSARTNGVCACMPACVHVHVCTYVYMCTCVCVYACVCPIPTSPFHPHIPLPTSGVPMFVTNKGVFGYLVSSPEDLHTFEEARQEFINFKLKTLGEAMRGRTSNVR